MEHHEHHHHHHGEEGHARLARIIVASVLLLAAVIIEKNTRWTTWQYLLLYLVPYLVVGWDTLKEAAEGLLHGEALSEDFLMSLATLGALGIGFMPGSERRIMARIIRDSRPRPEWENWLDPEDIPPLPR